MYGMIRAGVLTVAAVFASNALATELETEAQQLGYIIGMDIGKSLKQQGADIDLDSLFDAIRAIYELSLIHI